MKARLIRRSVIAVTGVVLLAFGLAGSALAAEFRGGDTVIIPAGEVIDDDLFISANRVEMNGTVNGDLFATGVEVAVNGTVEGSLMMSGQTLAVNGQVNGSLYGGGYSLFLGRDARVGRNVYFGGFSLESEAGSQIGRSLFIGGYQAILGGEVGDDVSIGGVALELNGTVGGDVNGEVGDPDTTTPPFFMPNFPGSVPMIAPGLRISSEAEIGGAIRATETDFQVPEARPGSPGSRLVLRLGRALAERAGEFIALIIVGALILRIWPLGLRRAGAHAQEQPLPSAGWGCVVTAAFFFGVPLAALIIFALAALGGAITFGQLFSDILGLGMASLGLVVSGFALVVSVVTKAIVAFLVGRLLLDRLATEMAPGFGSDLLALALGALIYEILRAIPVLGWLISVLVTLIGLGALFFLWRQRDTALADSGPPVEAAA